MGFARIAFVALMVSSLSFADERKYELLNTRPAPGTFYGGGLSFIAISPDGKSIAQINAGQLSIRKLYSSEESMLLPKGSVAALPRVWATWAPDGKSLYYLHSAEKVTVNDLWRVDIATHKTELLIKNIAGSASQPSPSPDGRSIAFWRGHTLMIAGADGKNERALCEKCDPWRGLTFSPDSSQITVSMMAERAPDFRSAKLHLLSAATGQVRPLASFSGNVRSLLWPAWSSGPFLCLMVADNDRKHFQMISSEVWHVDASTGKQTQVTQPPLNYFAILGAGPEEYSLLVSQMPPEPNGWDNFLGMLERIGLSLNDKPKPAMNPVILTLRK